MTIPKMTPSRRLKKSLMGDYALDNWHLHRVDRDTFTIYLGSDPRYDADPCHDEMGVEFAMADRLEMSLHILTQLDPKRPILIVLASCGGNWEEGMQMFGAMLVCPNPITVLGLKHCRSMTSLIPLAADKFVMRPPAEFMYHYGTWGYEGKAGEEAWTAFENLKHANDMMLRIYVARMKEQGKYNKDHPAKIRAMLEDNMRRKIDVFLSTDEAARWGFSDGVCVGPVERAAKKNIKRRNAMMALLRRPLNSSSLMAAQ